MPGISAKRVVLYRFDRQPLEAFCTDLRFEIAAPLELMSLEGSLLQLAYHEVKALCFVSEAGPAHLFQEQTTFDRRPKIPGLWARFLFRDGDSLDGVLSHNLAEWPEAGYLATPPRAGALRQRVFLPRAALLGAELRGIIGKPPVNAAKSPAKGPGQLSMFDG